MHVLGAHRRRRGQTGGVRAPPLGCSDTRQAPPGRRPGPQAVPCEQFARLAAEVDVECAAGGACEGPLWRRTAPLGTSMRWCDGHAAVVGALGWRLPPCGRGRAVCHAAAVLCGGLPNTARASGVTVHTVHTYEHRLNVRGGDGCRCDTRASLR